MESKDQKEFASLIGLAAGDALGAPVEFLRSLQEIQDQYGPEGITDFAPFHGHPAGSYTDDTQMSLATARGILDAFSAPVGRRNVERHAIIHSVHARYLEWLRTQDDPKQNRAPGTTCIRALRSGRMGTIEHPINDSKGCGGVMRTAPVGLVFSGREAFQIGAECAAITHGHPSGYLPAGFIAELVSHLIEGQGIQNCVEQSRDTLRDFAGHDETLAKVDQAIRLAASSCRTIEAMTQIGEGWTGEEALGIAIYCALKFPTDFEAGVIAAVNHGGDSDSTGSITGAILGASLGIEAIPKKWIDGLEDADKIQNLAGEMRALRERLSPSKPPNRVVITEPIVIELDRTMRSADWPKYNVLYKKGYTPEEADEIMRRVLAGEIHDLLNYPPKKSPR